MGSNRTWVLPEPVGTNAFACAGRFSASIFNAMFTGRRCDRNDPSTATPIVAPTLRKNWIWLVTTPMNRGSTADWTAFRYSGKVMPTPSPMMTRLRTISICWVSVEICDMR
jgi:hypothetical protein